MWCAVVLVLTVATAIAPTNGCIRRRSKENGDDDGYYCVCNASYCDQPPDAIRQFNPAKYVMITTSKSGLFFNVSNGIYKNTDESGDCKRPDVNRTLLDTFSNTHQQMCFNKKSVKKIPPGSITINRKDVYQKILGFGGAVTDSAAINIRRLTDKTSKNLLKSYFGLRSIGYNFIRTPMGGADFSRRPYTYDMIENDTSLRYFRLQPEDFDYKIPVIKQAQRLEGKIKLITAPWTASPWMKTNNSWTHNSKLRPEYRQLWANYFVKYFQNYRNNGLEFWGTTTQNEPENYKFLPISFNLNAMAWSAEEERDWIINYLAPALRKNFGHIKIFSMDDNRMTLFHWPQTVFQDKKARDIISGIAVHFYFDREVDPKILDEVKQLFPEKSLIYTEASTGVFQKQNVILGSWNRGEIYATSIIENMSHWVSAWIDWNIALDTIGGPNWIKNYVDSPIIVNSAADEFYKQPMFYVIGHFSKYVPPNSVRIGTTSSDTDGIQNVAFSTPDNGVVLVILNKNEEDREILINDSKKGATRINVLGKSINTVKYW